MPERIDTEGARSTGSERSVADAPSHGPGAGQNRVFARASSIAVAVASRENRALAFVRVARSVLVEAVLKIVAASAKMDGNGSTAARVDARTLPPPRAVPPTRGAVAAARVQVFIPQRRRRAARDAVAQTAPRRHLWIPS